MMKPETLREYRRVVDKFDHRANTERERQLIDSHLEALDELGRLRAYIAQEDQICPFDCDHCHDEDCPCANCTRVRG